MKKHPDLKVVIISSPKFLKNKKKKDGTVVFENLNKIRKLEKEHANRFSLVLSPDIRHYSPGKKHSTNHTKCTLIDYGKFGILGGSGIKDNFAKTGQSDLTVKQFYEKQGMKPPPSADQKSSGQGFVSAFIPGNFRDMDFVFRSTSQNGSTPLGYKMYTEALLLANWWERYNLLEKKPLAKNLPPELSLQDSYALKFVGKFREGSKDLHKPIRSKDSDTVTNTLLRTPVPHLDVLDAEVDRFSSRLKEGRVAQAVRSQGVFSGPEHSRSAYAEKVIQEFKEAKKEIIINHMYFHPTQEVFQALVDAANRGVKVKVISCGKFNKVSDQGEVISNPASQSFFGPRNLYNYYAFLKQVDEKYKGNIEFYEYQQHKMGNHKKAIIVDDTVIAGSSNFAYKSLQTASDHEINFVAKSEKLVEETKKVFDEDLKRSEKIDVKPPRLRTRWMAALHRLGAPKWG